MASLHRLGLDSLKVIMIVLIEGKLELQMEDSEIYLPVTLKLPVLLCSASVLFYLLMLLILSGYCRTTLLPS